MHMHPAYAVFVEGDDHIADRYVGVLSVSLSTIKQYYDEKYDTYITTSDKHIAKIKLGSNVIEIDGVKKNIDKNRKTSYNTSH